MPDRVEACGGKSGDLAPHSSLEARVCVAGAENVGKPKIRISAGSDRDRGQSSPPRINPPPPDGQHGGPRHGASWSGGSRTPAVVICQLRQKYGMTRRAPAGAGRETTEAAHQMMPVVLQSGRKPARDSTGPFRGILREVRRPARSTAVSEWGPGRVESGSHVLSGASAQVGEEGNRRLVAVPGGICAARNLRTLLSREKHWTRGDFCRPVVQTIDRQDRAWSSAEELPTRPSAARRNEDVEGNHRTSATGMTTGASTETAISQPQRGYCGVQTDPANPGVIGGAPRGGSDETKARQRSLRVMCGACPEQGLAPARRAAARPRLHTQRAMSVEMRSTRHMRPTVRYRKHPKSDLTGTPMNHHRSWPAGIHPPTRGLDRMPGIDRRRSRGSD